MALTRTRIKDVVITATDILDTSFLVVDADQGGGSFLYEKMTGAKFKEIVQALAYDAKLLSNIGLSVVANTPTNGLTISLKQKDGATDPGSTSDKKVIIAFRSSTLTSGATVFRTVTAALSTVISSGSTAGHFAAKNENVHLFAIDNAGTVELAWSSSNTFSEADLQTTTAEGGAGAADSKTTLYSTTARSNIAIRYLGFFVSNQATPGTWTSAIVQVTVTNSARIQIENGVIADTGNGRGSTDTRIRRITNTTNIGPGTAVTHATSAANGSVFTINMDGRYVLEYADADSTAPLGYGFSINSTQLTTAISTITAANRLALFLNALGTTYPPAGSIIRRLKVGDVIRPHVEGAIGNATTLCYVRIERIGD